MLWLKAFHLVFVVCWFAGIFYLPRLFVYHAMATDRTSIDRFEIMERKLYRGIMTPCAVLAVVLGLAMLIWNWDAYAHAGWMHAKLALALVLIGYHYWCGRIRISFVEGRNRRSHVFYRYFNEAPLVLLIAIVILVIVRPF